MPKKFVYTNPDRFRSFRSSAKPRQIAQVAEKYAAGTLTFVDSPSHDPNLSFSSKLEAFFKHRIKQFEKNGFTKKGPAINFQQNQNWLIEAVFARNEIKKNILEELNDVFAANWFSLMDPISEPLLEIDYIPGLGFSLMIGMTGTLRRYKNEAEYDTKNPCHNFRLRITIKQVTKTDNGKNTEIQAYGLLTHDLFLDPLGESLYESLEENYWQFTEQNFSSDLDSTLFDTLRFPDQLTPHVVTIFEFFAALKLKYYIVTNRCFFNSFLKICKKLKGNHSNFSAFTVYYVVNELRNQYNLHPQICTLFDCVEPDYFKNMMALEQEIIKQIQANADSKDFITLIKEVATVIDEVDKSKDFSLTDLINSLKQRLASQAHELRLSAEIIDDWIEKQKGLLTQFIAELELYRKIFKFPQSNYKGLHFIHLLEKDNIKTNKPNFHHLDDDETNNCGMALYCQPTVSPHHINSRDNKDAAIFYRMLEKVARAEGLDLEANQLLLHRDCRKNPLLAYVTVKYLLYMKKTPAEIIEPLIEQIYTKVYIDLFPAQKSSFDELVTPHDAKSFCKTNRFTGNIQRDFKVFKYLTNLGTITDNQVLNFFVRRYHHLSRSDKTECIDLVLSKKNHLHMQAFGIAEWNNPVFSQLQKLRKKYKGISLRAKLIALGSGIAGLGCYLVGLACPAVMVTAAGKTALTWGGFSLGISTAGGHLIHTIVQSPAYSGNRNNLLYDAVPESSKPEPTCSEFKSDSKSSYTVIELGLTSNPNQPFSESKQAPNTSNTVVYINPIGLERKNTIVPSPPDVPLEIKTSAPTPAYLP